MSDPTTNPNPTPSDDDELCEDCDPIAPHGENPELIDEGDVR